MNDDELKACAEIWADTNVRAFDQSAGTGCTPTERGHFAELMADEAVRLFLRRSFDA